MQIQSIKIDSTNSFTDLCLLGVTHPTDKSPYNMNNNLHKHPYSAIYNLLFSSIRNNPIKLGEVGILDNMSMICWRKYFPNALLYGYEWFDSRLQKAIDDNLPNVEYVKMNVESEKSIETALSSSEGKFDVLIDDSTHIFEHQIKLINVGHKYVKSGGYLIVEDIFLQFDENNYKNALDHLKDEFSFATFIIAEHEKKHSPGWDNDKLLILIKK